MGAKINNAELIKRLIDKAKINIQLDKVPTELAEKILPVIIVAEAEKLVHLAANIASDATTSTILTTSSTKDTFLIGAALSIAKDAVSDSTASNIFITPFGSPPNLLLNIRYEPTTAASNLAQEIMFPLPIKLERGSTITVNNGTATASIDAFGMIFYYEVEL